MSWDVLLVKFPEEIAEPAEVPRDYRPPPVGTRVEVVCALRKLLRNLQISSPAFISILRSGFTMEISLGNEEPCSQMVLHVSGNCSEATRTILRIAGHFGMRAIDCSTSEFIEKAGESNGGGQASEKERQDEARYRRAVEEYAKNPIPRQPQPLPGLTPRPCERIIYFALKPGESPRRLQKAVYQHWGDLYKERGELPTGVMGPTSIFTLPDGEAFCDFSARRYPERNETEDEMVPMAGQSAALLREYGVTTGRSTGQIENGSLFVCTDGRRVSLTECLYQQLWTEADFSRKAKRRRLV